MPWSIRGTPATSRIHERTLLTQRIYQIGCGYEDGNDSNSLRHAPMFKLGAERLPFDGGHRAGVSGDDIAF